MFPIRTVPENDVKKPSMLVFKDMDDYRKNGKNVDAVFSAGLKKVKKSPGKSAQKVRHKKFGLGTVVERKGESLVVQFEKLGGSCSMKRCALIKG